VTLSVICLSFFLSALHGYRSSLEKSNALMDNQLQEIVRQLEILYTHQQKNFPDNLFQVDTFFQIIVNQTVVAASPNAPEPHTLQLKDGLHYISHLSKRWRVLIKLKNDTVFIAGIHSSAHQKMIDGLIVNSLLPVFWSLPILALIIWFVIRMGLNPLKTLANLLLEKSHTDLSPINIDDFPIELHPIVSSLNSFMSNLNQAYAREKHFASDAAHELRTPIAALKVGIYNLNNQLPNNKLLEPIQKSIEKLAGAVEQILILNRLTPNASENTFEHCSIKNITQQSIITLYHEIEQKNHDIELTSEEFDFFGSPFGIETLIKNLVENAVKYTPRNGKIRISVSKLDDDARIIIEDSGPGIPPEHQERIFDRFYRVGGDRNSSSVQGSGLGLSIVKNIVDLHEGKIEASNSKQLGGLMITVYLPLKHDQKWDHQ